MKVTVSPDGTMVFDVDTVDQIVDLAYRLKADGPAPAPRKPKKKPKPKTVEGQPLNVPQAQTWQWLTAHDDAETGLSAGQYAADTGVTHAVAENRLRKLMTLGLAHKIAPGRYRPGPPPTDPPTRAELP